MKIEIECDFRSTESVILLLKTLRQLSGLSLGRLKIRWVGGRSWYSRCQ